MKSMTMFAVVALAFVSTAAMAQQPANDDCADCVAVTVGSVTAGTTYGAAYESPDPGTCGTTITAPGVWYKVEGTGNTMTASTCNDSNPATGSTNYDTKINVYCLDCAAPKCVDGNDDGGGCSGFSSWVSWPSQAGAEYKILVQGFAGDTGDFNLAILDNGAPATALVECIADADADSDGVPDTADLCPNTVIPEGIPKGGNPLGVNRWALYTPGDGDFDTTAPNGRGRGPQMSFSIEDTAGCSCEQILSELGIAGQGHEFFGCSISVMQTWIDQITGP